MAFTIISSSSHSRIGTGDLNRIPKRKTLERQPATASLISSEGTKVYTGCIRGQVGLAGRCLIDYEQRIRRVSVFLRKCNSRPSSAAASGMTSGRSENAEHFQPTASPLTFPFSGQSCAATLAKNALRFTDSLAFAKPSAQYCKFALVDSATCGPSRGGVFGTQDVRSYFVGNKPLIEENAFRNSSLQAAYFILAARAFRLDCGPMSGFDADRLNAEFFPDGKWKVNLLCTWAMETRASSTHAILG